MRSIVYGVLICGALTRCKWYGNGKLLNEVSSNSTELVGVWNPSTGISRMLDMDRSLAFLARFASYLS